MNEHDIFIEYEGSSLDLSEPRLNSSPRAFLGRPSNSSNLLVTATPREVQWSISSQQLDPTYTGDIIFCIGSKNHWENLMKGIRLKVLGKSMHVHLQVGFAGLRSNDLVPKCNLQDRVVWKTTESSYSFAVAALLFLFLRCYYYCCCCGCCCCHFLTAPSLPRNLLVALSGSAPGSRNKAAEWWSEYKNYDSSPNVDLKKKNIYICLYQIFTFHTFHATKKGSKNYQFQLIRACTVIRSASSTRSSTGASIMMEVCRPHSGEVLIRGSLGWLTKVPKTQ